MSPRDLQEVCWFAKCGPTEKVVLMCLAFHATPDGGRAYPGIRRMQRLTGLAKSSVEKSIATLVGRGYISIVRHGNQVSANEYKLNLATLMEHAIEAPELRPGVSLVAGQGVSREAGQGVPGGVPMQDREVSRSEAKGVPPGGTEQTTTLTTEQIEQQEEKGTELWGEARATLRKQINPHSWEIWIRPIKATLEGETLALILPSEDFLHVVKQYDFHPALDAAAATTGIKYERLIARCPEKHASNESTTASSNAHQHPRQWRRRA